VGIYVYVYLTSIFTVCYTRKRGIIMKKSAGFTLIELLIVIALLGALAVGLLATIDPFEQLKKGRDTSMRNTVSELYNANLRYYATKGMFPWNTLTSTATYTGESVTSLTTTNGVIDELTNSGELKAKFVQLAGAANLRNMFLSSTDVAHVAVCFMPESKSFQKDNNTQYDNTGTITGGCKSQSSGTGGTDCYYCVQ
jgi:prepilin-type N-terminal cleavage/methylation domain-containing protein